MIFGGDLLMGSGAETEEVTQLVVGAAKSAGRSWALEPAYRTVVAFDTAMILFKAVIQVLAVAMPDTCTQGGPDRAELSCLSVLTRLGVTPVTTLADSKNAFAASMSRCSLNITSTSVSMVDRLMHNAEVVRWTPSAGQEPG